MQIHKNSALTVRQREQIQQALRAKTSSYRQLAARYGVNMSTIQRWGRRPNGQPGAAGRPPSRTCRTPAYEAAVLAYRAEYPRQGPVRIAHELRPRFAQAHRGTVLSILQAHGLTRPAGQKKAYPAAGGPAPGADGRPVSAQTAAGPRV